MFKQVSPCKDCMNRTVACHDSCYTYKKWKSAFDGDRQKYVEDKMKRKKISETMDIPRKTI